MLNGQIRPLTKGYPTPNIRRITWLDSRSIGRVVHNYHLTYV